jgi:hypothetical protein
VTTPEFERAMIRTLMEDASRADCISCGNPDPLVAVWRPPLEKLRADFGFRDGEPKSVVYPICADCEAKTRQSVDFALTIESLVISALRDEGWLGSAPRPSKDVP